jgi:hypothetical protein
VYCQRFVYAGAAPSTDSVITSSKPYASGRGRRTSFGATLPGWRPTFRQVAHLLELSENLPGRIEIVDLAERIDPLLAALGEMIGEGLVTVSPIHIMKYWRDPK